MAHFEAEEENDDLKREDATIDVVSQKQQVLTKNKTRKIQDLEEKHGKRRPLIARCGYPENAIASPILVLTLEGPWGPRLSQTCGSYRNTAHGYRQ